jgi:CTP-dependent riboflavin kinase
MATNICSKSRIKFVTVKELAEELSTSVQQIYKILKNYEMEQCIKKIGTAGIRIEKEKFYEILEQIYR